MTQQQQPPRHMLHQQMAGPGSNTQQQAAAINQQPQAPPPQQQQQIQHQQGAQPTQALEQGDKKEDEDRSVVSLLCTERWLKYIDIDLSYRLKYKSMCVSKYTIDWG